MKNELVKLIHETTNGCLCFECKEHIAKEIESCILNMHVKMGILTEEDQLYKGIKVKDYLLFFSELSKHKDRYHQALDLFQLQDLCHVKINKLTPSQIVRVKAAREMIKNDDIIYIKEPLRNLNDQDIEFMLKWIDQLVSEKKKIMIVSNSLKDICMMPGSHYYIDKDFKIQKITNLVNQEEITQPLKISAKMDDKIMLFNPNEIDYIESLEGHSYVYVRNSGFVCSQTMDELETKLKRFGFYRSHRSYLVNMQKVIEVVKWTRNSYSLKLENMEDVRIPLSKGRIDEMKNLYDF